VSTPLGLGTVVYVRMAPPNFTEMAAVSVALDAKLNRAGYTGTMFDADDVSEVS
jgi:hypothetical protein